MNVTRVERPTGRGGAKGGCVSTTTTCNIEDGSDYEYVWTMSPPPPLLSSGRLLSKMRLRRLLPALDGPAAAAPVGEEDTAAARSPAEQCRPDLVSRLDDGAFEGGEAGASPGRHRRRQPRRRSEGFPEAAPSARCTCGFDGEATGGPVGDDTTTDSPPVRVRFRNLSGEEEGEHLLDSSSSSLLLHRTRGVVSPAADDEGIELGTVAACSASGTARPGADADGAGGLASASAGGALRRVCRHCRMHVVAAADDGGSGSLRFAPPAGGAAGTAVRPAPPCLVSFAKRLTEKGDGSASKHGGRHEGTAVLQSLHNA